MSNADEVLNAICHSYPAAVNASDSEAYANLFCVDAIRLPPGAPVDYGRDQIRAAEQADYDAVDLSVEFTPVDALQVTDDWVYGIAEVDGVATTKADRTQTPIRFTVTWLLQKADSGSWLIARQMWHNRGSA